MTEIERKYKLAEPPPAGLLVEGRTIQQGYLPSDLRVRRISHKDCFLTLKDGRGVERLEWEVPIPEWAFEKLWPQTKDQRLEKIRYKVPYGTHTLEIDYFPTRELWLLECEFSSVEEAYTFILPDWAEEAEEVTATLTNKDLAC